MSNNNDGTVEIRMSRDKLSAVAVIEPARGGGRSVETDDVLRALAASGVGHGIADTERIQVYVEKGLSERVEFLAASGTRSTMGKDAVLEFPWLQGEAAHGDFPARPAGLCHVKAGDVVAKKTPAQAGADSVNILGEAHPGEWGFDVNIEAGDGVQASDDGLTFTALMDGAPRVVDGVICVDPVYAIPGDVDDTTGNIKFQGALDISGGVRDGFIVECSGNIYVAGDVGDAHVMAGGDVIVDGDIKGGGQGLVQAQGAVFAAAIRDAGVEAGGNVAVTSAISNSKVRANGSVTCSDPDGRISGGEIRAYGHILAAHLGKDKDTKTKLATGHRFDVETKNQEAEQKIKQLEKEIATMRKSLDSDLMAGDAGGKLKKQLNAFEAERLRLQRQISERTDGRQVNTLSTVRGLEYIHPGCMISIGNRIKMVRESMKNATWSVDQNVGVKLTYFDEKTGATKVQGAAAGAVAKTALIVDDAKTMRFKLRKLMENVNINVIGEAENGRQGVEMFMKLQPDIVTMDINMPDIDGITALQAIRKARPQARVVMISAMGEKERVLESMRAGALDFVSKPIVPDIATGIILRVANQQLG